MVERRQECFGLKVGAVQCGLTHTVTHTAKRTDGINGQESAKDHACPERKGPQSARKRHIEGRESVGKDEVSSSNLDSSSKKLLKSVDFGSFCSVFSL